MHYGEVVNFRSLSLRSFLQKIRIILLNSALTPQESLKNLVLKKLKKKGVKRAKKHVAGVWKGQAWCQKKLSW